METVPALATSFSAYGWATLMALMSLVVAKLYYDVQALNRELRDITRKTAERDTAVVDALNRSSRALEQNSATLAELRLAVKEIMELKR